MYFYFLQINNWNSSARIGPGQIDWYPTLELCGSYRIYLFHWSHWPQKSYFGHLRCLFHLVVLILSSSSLIFLLFTPYTEHGSANWCTHKTYSVIDSWRFKLIACCYHAASNRRHWIFWIWAIFTIHETFEIVSYYLWLFYLFHLWWCYPYYIILPVIVLIYTQKGLNHMQKIFP